MILIATYDFHQPGCDYPSAEKLLKSASGGSVHLQESVWLLDTLKGPKWWRAGLKKAGDEDDSFFIAQLHEKADWSGRKMGNGGAWLNDPARRWKAEFTLPLRRPSGRYSQLAHLRRRSKCAHHHRRRPRPDPASPRRPRRGASAPRARLGRPGGGECSETSSRPATQKRPRRHRTVKTQTLPSQTPMLKTCPRGQRREQLLAAIKASPGARPADLAKSIGIKPAQVHALIAKARSEKLIVKKGHGYALKS